MLSDVRHYVPDGNGGLMLASITEGKVLSEKMYAKFREGKQLKVEEPKYKKKCPNCGKHFKTNSKQVKYCPWVKDTPKKDSCQYQFNGKRKRGNPERTVTCKLCKKDFVTTLTKAVFCNNPCVAGMELLKNYDPKPCAICGEMFKPFQKHSVYCQDPCSNRTLTRLSGASQRARAKLPKCVKPVLIEGQYWPSFPKCTEVIRIINKYSVEKSIV